MSETTAPSAGAPQSLVDYVFSGPPMDGAESGTSPKRDQSPGRVDQGRRDQAERQDRDEDPDQNDESQFENEFDPQEQDADDAEDGDEADEEGDDGEDFEEIEVKGKKERVSKAVAEALRAAQKQAKDAVRGLHQARAEAKKGKGAEPGTAAKDEAPEASDADAEAEFAKAFNTAIDAVSYTHLTLPTNREV